MSRPSVTLIDYGMGNLGSLRRSLEECGAEPRVTEDPHDLGTAERIILPGVGSFAEGMSNLRARGWIPRLQESVVQRQVPLLGICLGMQLLADKGMEGGEVLGLGLVPGEVLRLVAPDSTVRIPHMGWNEVFYERPDALFDGIPEKTDFYFVHSYHFIPASASDAISRSPYCGRFVSGVRRGHIVGVQFHPEKSQKPGLCLLRNFLASNAPHA